MMSIDRVTRGFLVVAGGVLLTGVAMLVVGNLSSAAVPSPPDPVLRVPLRLVLWLAAGLMLAAALFTLWGGRTEWQLGVVLSLAAGYWIYRMAARRAGCEDAGVYFAPVADVFGLSGGALLGLADVSFGAMFRGGVTVLLWPGRRALEARRRREEKEQVKTCCPVCGGHLQFAIQNAGQKISCPHCANIVTLAACEQIKISCYFCKGHIQFPVSAAGRKIPCPHCRKEITLMRPG